jgi:2-polyprenyl-6-methoxyphenol hydroxylase-like FAD-dependent oxidoreductase
MADSGARSRAVDGSADLAAIGAKGDPTMARTAIIVGCGIAGPVMALALRRAGWSAAIHEARAAPDDEAGVFLNVVANGMNALRTLGVHDRVAACGFPFGGIVFHEEHGREIGTIAYGDQERDFGASGIIIKRGALQRALREAARDADIPIHFGKRLSALRHKTDRVEAVFADGTTAAADILVGCDGINSRTRGLAMPDAPAPEFTGLIGYGGFSRGTGLPGRGRLMHMVFGRRAFFGHATAPDGEVYWFGNAAGEPTADPDAAAARVVTLHAADPEPVPGIVAATRGEIGWYPIHELPPLRRWHAGRVVVVGDAAHAMAPHAGQGASLAIEDAIILARCLRDLPAAESAFTRYQAFRQERVERIGREARRTGARKIPGPVGRVFRNVLLPVFLRLGEKAAREAYAYRIDWDEPVADRPAHPRAA